MDPLLGFESFLTNLNQDPFHLLLILMVSIWTVGRIFSHLNLPLILGEILAGVVLGPPMLGIIQESEIIHVFAELGVFFMMFHAGLDTSMTDLIKSSKVAFFGSIGGLGTILLLSFLILPFFGLSPVGSVFMGTILAAASFPVIMRMLRHYQLKESPLGKVIIAGTAFTETMVFIIASILLSLVGRDSLSLLPFLIILVKVAIFLWGIVFLGRYVLPRFKKFLNREGSKAFTFSLIVALVFGLFAELIGLHIILGAYLGGMFVREEIQNEKVFAKVEDRFFGFSYSFLGPIFFASVGLKMSFDAFPDAFLLLGVLLGIAIVGQLLGSGAVGYFFGKMPFRDASVFWIGMLGRGATGIIIAALGFEAGILDANSFSLAITASIVTIFIVPFLMKYAIKSEMKKIKI